MNVGEFGVAFLMNTGFDLSGATSLAIKFTKPSGATLTVSNVDSPNVNTQTSLGLFLANEYARYIFQSGDVIESGRWNARVIYDDVNEHLISDVGQFTVNP